MTAVPELRPGVKSGGGRSTLTLPVITPRLSDISNIPSVPKHFLLLHIVLFQVIGHLMLEPMHL